MHVEHSGNSDPLRRWGDLLSPRPTMFMHDVRHASKRVLGRHPKAYLTVASRRHPQSALHRDTDLVIDGFGRSAVTFAVVAFQVINLPVEFNASSRAKLLLVDQGIVDDQEMGPVKSVLNAAALTYVAATLQSILTLLYFVMRYSSDRR